VLVGSWLLGQNEKLVLRRKESNRIMTYEFIKAKLTKSSSSFLSSLSVHSFNLMVYFLFVTDKNIFHLRLTTTKTTQIIINTKFY
jgi:hypothetical protein